MGDAQRVSTRRSVPYLAWIVCLCIDALGEAVAWFGSGTTNDDLVGDEGGGVVTVVVEIDIDVVGILVDDTIAQLSIHESELVAGVVLERNLSPCRGLRTEVGERIVGDELVVVACHEEVACAMECPCASRME